MVTYQILKDLALSFPETTEEPHFERTSFKVKKKIFATYDDKNNSTCLKLSMVNQNIFSLVDKKTIYPVDNKWGRQGWTIIEMKSVSHQLFKEVLISAYCEVAPRKLANNLTPLINKNIVL